MRMLTRCTHSVKTSISPTLMSAHECKGRFSAFACVTRPLYNGLSVGLGYTTYKKALSKKITTQMLA